MNYLQIILLLLISLTQIIRPSAVSDWERFNRAKLCLIISFSINVFFFIIAKATVDNPLDPIGFKVFSWQNAFISASLAFSAAFYLYSLALPKPALSQNPNARVFPLA